MATRVWMLAVFGPLITPASAAATQNPAPSEKETKICRQSETRTGSRIRTGRQCRTAEEWRKEDEERSRVPVSLTVTEGQPDGPSRPRTQ